ncbi:MAG: hypothetical protein ACPG4Z_00055 [Chitinophagales bacterium]
MNKLLEIGSFIYMYCTDFVINLANMLGLSYYEINAMIFCVIWPLLTLILLIVFVYLFVKTKNINK